MDANPLCYFCFSRNGPGRVCAHTYLAHLHEATQPRLCRIHVNNTSTDSKSEFLANTKANRFDNSIYTLSRLSEYYKHRPLETPNSSTHSPLTWAFNMDGSDWDHVYNRTPENAKKFNLGMNATSDAQMRTQTYPFATELADISQRCVADNRVLIVDVGGGNGAVMKNVRQTFPQLQGDIIVEDLSGAVEQGNADASLATLNIQSKEYDFRKPQPVQNAAVYYIGNILHSWPDEGCVAILKNQAAAMGEDSKLLIFELIMPKDIDISYINVFAVDLVFWQQGGSVRTVEGYTEILEKAGLEFVKVWPSKFGPIGVIEARLRRSG